MKFIAVVLIAVLAVASAQYNFGAFGSLGAFSGGLDAQVQNARDPRANTGPVVFPMNNPQGGETSGVVVGASGYGFVPPNNPSSRYSFY